MIRFISIKRIFQVALLLSLLNVIILTHRFGKSLPINVTAIAFLVAFFIVLNINPTNRKEGTPKLKRLIGGYELLVITSIVLIAESGGYVILCTQLQTWASPLLLILNGLVGLAVILPTMWNGIIRIVTTSSQISHLNRILLLTTWWIPVFNIIVFCECCRIARREYIFETEKIEMNIKRKDSDICKTKYPILLIHGIFWRDWKLFNYWGRIPGELMKNGATIYYGEQQSAAAMDVCSNEIKNKIIDIIEKENCSKVNIIAHSKGGLDARYAISCLGMDKHVASLTTIGTPHKGCDLVDGLIRIIPNKAMQAIAKRYNKAYKRLGDIEPDFYSGIYDLTAKKCLEFNEMVPDSSNVVYQSISSYMSSIYSAGFPLNIGYMALRYKAVQNDGFVSVASSKWGDFIGCFSTKNRRGVSHGDMIDLTRKNIAGFDIRECYVDIVKGLKQKGL